MKLIVGLGNPGDKYKNNRHNIGFKILDDFVVNELNGTFKYENKYKAETYESNTEKIRNAVEVFSDLNSDTENEKVMFVKPMTFMNKSGESVQTIKKFFNIEDTDILVIHDEIDLITGSVKSKFGGGLAGHNGLKSIAERIGTKEFQRLRIGIDRPVHKDMVSDYVLSNFKKDEIEQILDEYQKIHSIILQFLKI